MTNTPARILLTGVSGQLGWELLKVMPTLGAGVAMSRHQMDLEDPDSIVHAMQRVRPDVVVNAAAFTSLERAEDLPDVAEAVNAIAPGVIAEQAAELGCAMIHFSTDAVFDGSDGGPHAPSDPPCTTSVLGQTKLAGEAAVMASGVNAIILRLSGLISRRGRNFLIRFLDLAARRHGIRLPASRLVNPTWTRTVAEATGNILARSLDGGSGFRHFSGHEGVYHLASRGSASWLDVGHTILDHIEMTDPPTLSSIEEGDEAFTDTMTTALDSRLAEQTFGLEMPDWESDIRGILTDQHGPGDDAIFIGMREAG